MSGVWFAADAVLPEGVARNVRIEISDDGLFESVTPDSTSEGARILPGVVLPGFANCHSHAFHRALRGRAQSAAGSFWEWRQQMYTLASRLTPDSYLDLARAVYSEMVLAGFTTVAEFHYLHHDTDGGPYGQPNAMAEVLRQAARDAGIRLTLLDTCYLAGGLDGSGYLELQPEQRRFSDGSVEQWLARSELLKPDDHTRIGVAIHSVRAVPRVDLPRVVEAAGGRPLHVHLSEQLAENDASRAAFGMSPTELLHEVGALGATTTAVHATHVSDSDIALLSGSGSEVCLCPTTERDLADGLGRPDELIGRGVGLSIGTDQHVVIDAFEEARGIESHARLATGRRGHLSGLDLIRAMTRHDQVGWSDVGAIATGMRADLVAVRLDTVRTAGCSPADVAFAATASDIDTVIIDGRVVVEEGQHRIGDVGVMLEAAVEQAWHS